jgi:sulfate transport system permease protein
MIATRRSGVAAPPGFRLTLGFTCAYLFLIVLLPLSGLPIHAASLGWEAFWRAVAEPRVIAAFVLTLGTSGAAAAINGVFGLVAAWVLVRYEFPGRRIVDAAVDLPFALPTAVAGITLTTLYGPHGWLGAPLAALGVPVAFTPAGITVALIFIGLPFVIRALQPVIQDLEVELEEAAASLGAGRWDVVWRVIVPYLLPAWLTGVAMAFARAIGEYGSVVFISGNMPMRTELPPLLIMSRLEQYDYAGATAVAVVMLTLSFGLLWTINLLHGWSAKRIAP